MSDEITTWGKFETRSVVRPPIPLALNYDPDLAKEMEEYTWGKFETRSIVRPKLHVNMHATHPVPPPLWAKYSPNSTRRR